MAFAKLQCVDLFLKRTDPPDIATYPVEIHKDDGIYRVTSGPFIFEGHLQNRVLEITALLSLPESNIRSQLRGDLLYQRMITYFGREHVDKIVGNWFSGTNYDQFFNNLKNNATLEDAALYTWSGRQAAKYGYTVVERVELGVDFKTGKPSVTVIFQRP